MHPVFKIPCITGAGIFLKVKVSSLLAVKGKVCDLIQDGWCDAIRRGVPRAMPRILTLAVLVDQRVPRGHHGEEFAGLLRPAVFRLRKRNHPTNITSKKDTIGWRTFSRILKQKSTWYHGTMAPWYHGTVVPWYRGYRLPPLSWKIINDIDRWT